KVILLDGSRFDGEAGIDAKLGLVLTNSDNLITNWAFMNLQSVRFNVSSNISEASSNAAFPRGWTNADIGNTGRAGSARWENDQVTISACGARFWLPQPD